MTKHRRSWLLAIFAALVLPLLWAPAAHAISKIKIREVYSGTNDDSYVELEAFDYWGVRGGNAPGEVAGPLRPGREPDDPLHVRQRGRPRLLQHDVPGRRHRGGRSLRPNPERRRPGHGNRPGRAARRAGTSATLRSTASPGAPSPARQSSRPTPKAKPATPRSRAESPPARRSRRTIARNCPTWLEIEDDTDDSATDFFEADPDPHTPGNWPEENGEAIERECESGMPDDTAIVAKPPSLVANSGSAHFTYSATGATSFQCKLDTAPRYSTCPSGGQDYAGLAEGFHLFEVRALNGYGYDKTPAAYVWRVDTQAPLSEFLSRPGSQSFGRSAVFTFASNEPEATFLCSLDGAPSSPCVSGIRLTSLSTGSHTFNVAGGRRRRQRPGHPDELRLDRQRGPAADDDRRYAQRPEREHHGDLRPTTPTGRTRSSNAAWTARAFTSCPSSGATYVGLAKGTHTFRVRAIDSDDVVEPSPPSYSFTIAAPRRARTCKKGQRKKVVRGVVKCVKKPQRKRNTQRR